MKLKRKTFVLMIAAMMAAVLLGIVVPPYVAAAEKDYERKEILINLRQIVSTAFCGMMEKGVEKISFRQLYDEHYFHNIKVVAGESYDGIVITMDTRFISVTTANGDVIGYNFKPPC